MDDILKSEIFIVVYEKKDGVSFEEFGGLFRQIHGYNLNLSKFGYSSLRSLLNDMKDLIEIKITKGHQIIRCKSPSRHHVVVSHGNNEQVSGLSSGLPSSGPSPDPVVRKTDQAQPTQNHVKQVNSTNSATGKKAKDKPKHTCSTTAKNTNPAVNHNNSPLPVKRGITSNEKATTNNTTTNSHRVSLQVNNTNSATGKTSKEIPKPTCNRPTKNTDPAVNHKNNPQPVKCGYSSIKKTATKNKTTNSCSVSIQVNSTNSATSKTSKEKPKPTCSTTAKNINPAVNHKNNPQLVKCGFSSNEKTATKTETTNSLSGLPISKPLLASPAGNVAATSGATRTRQENNCTLSYHTPKDNLTHLQNNISSKTGAIENKVFSASGPNKNAGLLPTPTVPVKFNPFGVQPKMSYASVCAHNINNNHFNRNGQQCTPNNVRFNIGNRVNSANVTQSHSRAEPRPSIQPSSVIKENIQGLLSDHADGLSIFQLQKIYLFKYRQPLKFRGSVTLKQLLMELKDVVKTEGVGVQMLVFPAPAQNIQVTAARGDHDAALQVDTSLITEKDSIKEVVLNPHSVDFLKTQNDELQEATQLPFHDGQILAFEPYQIDPMEGNITEIVKTENTQPITQNMIEHISSNAHHEESPEEVLPVPASDAGMLPNQIKDNLQHKTPKSVQMLPQMNKSHVQEEMSYLCKNVIMKDTINTNGPLEITPQNSYSHRVILHSSGFSFVTGQPIDGPQNKATELNLAETNSVTEQKTPKNCDLTEYPLSNPRDDLQTETVLVQTEKPSLIQKDISQIRKTVEQAAHLPLNRQENAPNSQITNNRNVFLKPSSNEKTTDAKIIKKTSQQEASLPPPTNDLGRGENTHGPYVHDTVRATHMLSHVHKVPDILQNETKQNKSTLHTKQFDEFTSPEMIPQNITPQNSYSHRVILHSSCFSFVTGQPIDGPQNKAAELNLADKNSVTEQKTPKNCDLTESPLSNPRDDLQIETVLVQTEKPSLIQKDISQIRKTVEQAAHLPLNRQENAPNSQITNNRNVFLKPSSSEKTPDATIIKKSQQEASLPPPTNDLGRGENTHGPYVHDTELATHMLSHVHKVPDILQNETKQNKSTLQTKQFDEFISPEMIPQNSLLTSRPKQEIADPFQNIPTQPTISAAQSELPNNLDCITDQKDNNTTWQTSQEASCCIL